MRQESGANSWLAGWVAVPLGTLAGHPFDTIKVRVQVKGCNRLKGLWSGAALPVASRQFVKGTLYGTYGLLNGIFQRRTGNITLPWWLYGTSGGISGAVSALLQTPADYIKIRIQTSDQRLPIMGRATSIIQGTNIRGLYRGLRPMVLRDTLGFFVYFSLFEHLRRNLHTQGTFWKQFVLGSFVGCVSWVFQFPIDVIKSRIQASPNSQVSATQLARYVASNEGISVFFRGLSVALIRACVVHGTTMSVYETMLDYINSEPDSFTPCLKT
eukprot:TRINITY_DN4470_c0_g1_i1.p1 TRINITY_DN4470_c0_g1~~TRINITY_DN4470_c0_g1_i1.p1  ORF type:complete len:270 (+),score=20.04 TRINITY_DN4470_c0_g1_i1:191-1000(+)